MHGSASRVDRETDGGGQTDRQTDRQTELNPYVMVLDPTQLAAHNDGLLTVRTYTATRAQKLGWPDYARAR